VGVGYRNGPAGVALSPGPGPQPLPAKEVTVDERILVQRAQHYPTDQEHGGYEERNCLYYLEGWAFLGSINRDGEEVYEAIRCRRCGGWGEIDR
jgi:hypothetical protein